MLKNGFYSEKTFTIKMFVNALPNDDGRSDEMVVITEEYDVDKPRLILTDEAAQEFKVALQYFIEKGC